MSVPGKPVEISAKTVLWPKAEPAELHLPCDDPAERRKWERVSTAMPVRLRKFEPMSWRHGVCLDLSDGGIGLQTLEPLTLGDLIELEVPGPDGTVHLCGRIVHRFGHRYGLAYLGMSRLSSEPGRGPSY